MAWNGAISPCRIRYPVEHLSSSKTEHNHSHLEPKVLSKYRHTRAASSSTRLLLRCLECLCQIWKLATCFVSGGGNLTRLSVYVFSPCCLAAIFISGRYRVRRARFSVWRSERLVWGGFYCKALNTTRTAKKLQNYVSESIINSAEKCII
jgi:hypothetical protein